MSGAPQFPIPEWVGAQALRPGASAHKAGKSLEQRIAALEAGALGRPGPGVADGSTITSDSSQSGGVAWAGAASCFAHRSSHTAALTANVWTRIDLNAEMHDTASMHSTSVNPSRIYTPTAGIYDVHALVALGNPTTAFYYAFRVRHYDASGVEKTTDRFYAEAHRPARGVGAYEALTPLGGAVSCAAGDYFVMEVQPNIGTMVAYGGASKLTYLSVTRISIAQ